MERVWVVGIVFAALVGAASAPSPERHQYVGASKCKTCHGKELIGDQYSAWARSVHARAFETLKGEEALRIARERGLPAPPHESDECLRCHVTAHRASATEIAYEIRRQDGVQCESCHGPGKDFRKKKIMSDREKAVSLGLREADKDATICTACHNPESPTWDPNRYSTSQGPSGFDFAQAKERIPHPIPENVKGRYVELEKERREAAKQE
jgi:nitrate/TMAO reductase-like tetraheme cytochrome c subunit